jgi:hypothetical protein
MDFLQPQPPLTELPWLQSTACLSAGSARWGLRPRPSRGRVRDNSQPVWLRNQGKDHLKQVVLGTRIERPRRFRFEFLWFPAIFALGGVLSGLLAWSIGLGNFGNYPAVTGFLAALGFIFGLVVTAHYRFMPAGSMKADDPTA